MSSENRDNEGDLIDFHVRSPVLPRASSSIQIYPEASDNLIDTELPILEQKLQTATQTINPVTSSRRASVDVEDILITIDDDEVDAPQRLSDHFLDLCDNNLVENLEALSILKSLDDVLNASLLDYDDSIENGDEPSNSQDVEDCLRDLDNYLKTLDGSSSEEYSDSSNESQDDQPSTRSVTSSSDLTGNHSLEPSTDDESLRNKLRQMEENYTKFLASGCINRGYVDTETNESERRPLSACGMASEALNKTQPGRATVAVVRRERPSLRRAIENDKSRCGTERTSGPSGDSDEDIDWSWLQDIARDVTLERRAHAAGDCCTGTVVVEPPRMARPSSSSEPAMNEEPKEDVRSSTWLRSSMRRLRHLRLPSDEAPPQTESNVTANVPEPPRLEQLQVPTVVRPVSAPSRLPTTAVRVSTRSSRSRSRESRRSAVSHEPGGRARSSSASSRSRRPRSLSSSDSSVASSVDSTPSCTPVSSPTQNTQEQPTPTVNSRRYAFLVAGIFYGLSKHTAFKIKEGYVREEKEKRRGEKEAQLAAEKQAASERDIEEIIRIFRPKPPPETAVEVNQPGGSSDGGTEVKKVCKLKQKAQESSDNISYNHDTWSPNKDTQIKDTQIKDKIVDIEGNLPKAQTDIFSESINLKTADDFKNSSEIQQDLGDSEGNTEFKLDEEKRDDLEGYIIETFPDGIPIVDSKNENPYNFPKGKAK